MKEIRNINYKIERYHHDKYMYEKQLQEILQDDQEMVECLSRRGPEKEGTETPESHEKTDE